MAVKRDIKFAFHILFHPFDGFWDMKRENRGKLSVALLILLLWGFTNIFTKQVSAFLFRPTLLVQVKFLNELFSVVLLGGLFCIANWSVTTLMDGEGRMKDIVMTLGYAALPIVLIQIPLAAVSNVLTYSELNFYQILSWVSYAWFFVLLFFGILTIHQYSLLKGLFTLLLTLVAMVFIAFLCLIFFNILSQMVGLVQAIYTEIMLRSGG